MAVDKNQIQELLGSGLSNEIVATAVGCDPSYITQLMSQQEFASKVIELRTVALTANSRRDRTIDEIEDKILEKLDTVIDQNGFYKPADILRAAAVVNAMKRRGVPATESLTVNNTVVNLQMPVQIVHSYVKNPTGEVVEVDGKTLVTASSHTLLEELARTRGGKDGEPNKYREAGKFLPAAALQGSSG